MTQDDFTVRIDGHEVPQGPSQTGDFGLSREELKFIIVGQLARSRGRSIRERALFARVCTHMHLRPRGAKKEEMLGIFAGLLRELRDAGKVKLHSGKTALLVELA